VIYTATADDSADMSGGVSFSLADGSDAALSIDAATGEVSLSTDPDYETQSQYNFTVVATDAAGNASSQAVSMDVNNLDEVAPTVTSTDAVTIDEASGADQVIYTATADDSADTSDGVSFSLVDNTVYSSTSAAGDAAAGEQLISVSGSPSAQAGEQVSLAVNYNADSNELPGLGLRIHYDSSMLSVEGMTGVLDQDLIYTDTTSQSDSEDLDGNASTDAYVTVAWASLNGDWPNTELPDELLNVLFNVSSDASGSAAVGFSATSTPVGYDFSGVDYDLQIIDSPLSIMHKQ